MVDDLWSELGIFSEKFMFNRVTPNSTLLEEVLSLDAARLDTVEATTLRKYIVVLAQYFITLQFEENSVVAVGNAWRNSLESRIFSVLRQDPLGKIKTVAEKRGFIIETDEEAGQLEQQGRVADAKRDLIKGMSKPVEQYIQVLKKEIEARENEKTRG